MLVENSGRDEEQAVGISLLEPLMLRHDAFFYLNGDKSPHCRRVLLSSVGQEDAAPLLRRGIEAHVIAEALSNRPCRVGGCRAVVEPHDDGAGRFNW